MDVDRKQQDPTLVCTCNDLYQRDIAEAIDWGETDYREIFAIHGLQPRCGECVDHVQQVVAGRKVAKVSAISLEREG